MDNFLNKQLCVFFPIDSYLIILFIKVLRYDYQKINSLQVI